MNFFEEQDRARRNTTRLVILMPLAVVTLIAATCFLLAAFHYALIGRHGRSSLSLDVGSLIYWVSLIIISVVACGCLYKYLQLRGGGKVVAQKLGGRMINLKPQGVAEKRLLNVVEEMALASGISVPPVYVLDDPAINSFAAGQTPQNAVIGVTRGAIEFLNREELQGMIAHEFSHIFNGDMRLNMRMVSALHGILLMGLIGDFLDRGKPFTYKYGDAEYHCREYLTRPPLISALGIFLMASGYFGTVVGNLVKAAVSRQREYLADASAVLFTRNPNGIAGALKKMGGHQHGSKLWHPHSTQFSHLYFGQGVSAVLEGMLASHPPLEDRIWRIDETWDGEYPVVELLDKPGTHSGVEPNLSDLNSTHNPQLIQQLSVETFAKVTSAAIAAIGAPRDQHLAHARSLLQAIPTELLQAAHDPNAAQALVLGLLLDQNECARQQQYQALTQHLSRVIKDELDRLQPAIIGLTHNLTLPLIELSIPSLKTLEGSELLNLRHQLTRLVLADTKISLREWCLLRIIERNLAPTRALQSRYRLEQLADPVAILLSAVVRSGNQTVMQQSGAFNAAIAALQLPRRQLLEASAHNFQALNKALTQLNELMPLEKPKLLKAIAVSMKFDDKIDSSETELIRAIADSLDCPMPPLLVP